MTARQPSDRQPSEHQEQVALVRWLRDRGILVMSIPNGARTTSRGRRWLLDEGLEPGAPDLVLRTPPPGCPGVAIVAVELKRRGSGELSDAQRAWVASVADLPAWRVIVARGALDAWQQLLAMGYGDMKRGEPHQGKDG